MPQGTGIVNNLQQGNSILPPLSPSIIDTGQQSASHQTGTSTTILPPVTPPNPPVNPPIPPTSPPMRGNLPTSPPTLAHRSPHPPPTISGPINDCQRYVRVIAPTLNELVTVYVNGVPAGTAVSTLGDPYAGGGSPVAVPISGCLHAGDVVRATVTSSDGYTSTISAGITVVSSASQNVLTQHYDSGRTGWNPYEAVLNTTNVTPTSLKNVIDYPTDGKTYTQPLYLRNQFIPKLQDTRNLVIFGTENNTIYAYDADAVGDGSAALIWANYGGSSEPAVLSNREGEGDIVPVVGITGTPVIDCGCACGCGGSSSGGGAARPVTMYVVRKSVTRVDYPNGFFSHFVFKIQLHALDVTTGMDLANSPVELAGSVKGNGGAVSNDPNVPAGYDENDGSGNVVFNPHGLFNRSALLLLNGTVYVAIAALADPAIGAPNGWIFAFDAVTLNQKAIFCTAPDLIQDGKGKNLNCNSGIWGSGMGLATDGTFLYCTMADGAFNGDLGGTDFGDSAIKLTQDLKVVSFFTPANQFALNLADADFGSGGVLVIPSPQPGLTPNLMVTSGKTGVLFLLNRDKLGGYAGVPSNLSDHTDMNQLNTFTRTNADPPSDNPNALFSFAMPNGPNAQQDGDLNGGPAYYNDGQNNFLFYACDTQPLFSYALTNNQILKLGGSQETFLVNGTTVNISSNQSIDGTAIAWAVARDDGANNQQFGTPPHNTLLRAYDVSKLLKGDPNAALHPNAGKQNAGWPIGEWNGRAFIEPTIINGRVYVASDFTDSTGTSGAYVRAFALS